MRLEKIKANKYRLPQGEQERSEVILRASIDGTLGTPHKPRDSERGRNSQTTLVEEVATKGDEEDKERTTQENTPENTTPRGETRGIDIEIFLDQPARESIMSPADKRSSVGDSRAMNTTSLSVIQEVLLNKKKGKKSKFTVELVERDENGKSRVRIDIWEVDEKTPENDGTIGVSVSEEVDEMTPETDGTIGQSVHALTRDSSTPRVPMIQKERQYPSPRLTFGDDTRTFNRSLENKTPPDY